MSLGAESTCPHVVSLYDISWEDIVKSKKHQSCHTCGAQPPNLWLCMVGQCRYIGCGESSKDHSTTHFHKLNHALTINLTTVRVWCNICSQEVFSDRNTPAFVIPERAQKIPHSVAKVKSSPVDSHVQKPVARADDSDSDIDDDNVKPRGLTGLKNLGNTCYMNAALQALSNCPPLTRYFLDCSGFVRPEKSPWLSKSYAKLVTEIWHSKRPSYVIPSAVSNGMKNVHPMFRGYSQQDTQEFLRCFMDELHEELKQPVSAASQEECDNDLTQDFLSVCHDRQPSLDSNSSHSDVEYETCDSGRSSERSSAEYNVSSDDGSEPTELTRLNAAERNKNVPMLRSDTHLNKSSSNCVDTDNLPSSTKHRKDSANLLHKKKKTDNSSLSMSSLDEVTEVDSGGADYSDAVSELEPLQRSRSRSQASVKSNITTELEANSKCQPYISQSAHNTGKRKAVQYQSVISDVFDGKILSSVQCLTCERVSTTKETFQDLSLPIPSREHLNMLHYNQGGGAKGGTCGEVNPGWLGWMFSWMKSLFVGPTVTLQDCLAAFFSDDELKGDNMYSCSKCKKGLKDLHLLEAEALTLEDGRYRVNRLIYWSQDKTNIWLTAGVIFYRLRNGLKYSKVLELPEILCVHLKRFRHEFYSSKIGTYVSFPLEDLDMKPYLFKDCCSEVKMYDLMAVICHHGTAGGGHYTAYCLNYVSQQWYEFDDQYVTEVNPHQVTSCEAYVLFYRKKYETMISMRQSASNLIDAQEPSLLNFFVSKQWLNRFNTFAEPGPISNTDFLCHHGGVSPARVSHVDDLVLSLSQPVWEYLHDKFGGGPACTHLAICNTCQSELEQLKMRQKKEMEGFIVLNEEFQVEDRNPSAIYALSMAWFKEWEAFVKGKTKDFPGPIDNSRIALLKNGQAVIRQGSDYGQMSLRMWQYLHSIYGGGPEILFRHASPSLVPLHQMAASNAPVQIVVPTATTPTVRVSSQDDTSNNATKPSEPVASPPSDAENPATEASTGSIETENRKTNVIIEENLEIENDSVEHENANTKL